MATGKSTVGKELADRLGWPFHDLDSIVEDRCQSKYGVGISTLIDRGDESLFRLEERTFVTDGLLGLQMPSIVSLGGGTLHNNSLGDWLENHTTLIVLQATWSTVKERIMQSNRPLKDSAYSLYVERLDGYSRGYKVVVDACGVRELVDSLESWIRSHK